jgi:hypothetical protein
MPKATDNERNNSILQLRNQGRTLRYIGDKYNLSSEFIRQIVNKLNNNFIPWWRKERIKEIRIQNIRRGKTRTHGSGMLA